MSVRHIIKYAAVIIQDHKYLVVRDDDDIWKNVGGKLEEGETPEECLRREVREELGTELVSEPTYYFSCPTTQAVSDPSISLDIHLYNCNLTTEPRPFGEIEELHWLSRKEFERGDYSLTPQIKEHIVPRLIADKRL